MEQPMYNQHRMPSYLPRSAKKKPKKKKKEETTRPFPSLQIVSHCPPLKSQKRTHHHGDTRSAPRPSTIHDATSSTHGPAGLRSNESMHRSECRFSSSTAPLQENDASLLYPAPKSTHDANTDRRGPKTTRRRHDSAGAAPNEAQLSSRCAVDEVGSPSPPRGATFSFRVPALSASLRQKRNPPPTVY